MQHPLDKMCMLSYYFLLTQADSLLHPGKEFFGITAPHFGILQSHLHPIFAATEGQVCILGCEGVHQHQWRVHRHRALPRGHTQVSAGLHPTAHHMWSLKEMLFYCQETTSSLEIKTIKHQMSFFFLKLAHEPKTENNSTGQPITPL